MWNQITLDVPDDLKDALVGEAFGEGASGVWEATADLAGETRLTFYVADPSDSLRIELCIRNVFERCSLVLPGISRTVVEDRDWTEEWKKSYTSFPVGANFFLIPSWIDSKCPDDRLPIRIDPGQAFGTGTHETTQLTIEALERWVEPQHVVLDVGTGSGILAMASRMLGAKEVIACDIDPVAVHVALANIQRNHEPEVWTFCGSADALADNSIDLLLGNLTAETIATMVSEFHRLLRPAGMAILSGILNAQYEDVLEAFAPFPFTVHEKSVRGEWLALVVQKHGG